MTRSTKETIFQGTVFKGAAAMVDFVATLVLVKLLIPNDFGVVAAASVFTGLASRVAGGGLRAAMVQSDSEDGIYLSGLVGNLALSSVPALVLVSLSDLLARLLHTPDLSPVIRWLALAMIVDHLGCVPGAYLDRRMRFLTLSAARICGSFLGAVGAVTMAVRHPGPWALVAQVVIKGLTVTLLLWGFMDRSLLRGFSRPICGRLLRFGAKVLAADLLGMLGPSGVRFVMTRALGTVQLGIYEIAWRFVSAPFFAVVLPLSQAVFPVLCRKQDNLQGLKQSYMQLLAIQLGVVGPLIVMLVLCLGSLLPVIASERWVSAIPVARILVCWAVLNLVFGSSYLVYLATGKPGYRFVYLAVLSVTTIAGAVIGCRWGLRGAACGFVGGTLASLPAHVFFLGKAIPIRMIDYLRLWPSCVTVCLVALAGLMGLMLSAALRMNEWLSLLLVATSATGSYWLCLRAFVRRALTGMMPLFPGSRVSRRLTHIIFGIDGADL